MNVTRRCAKEFDDPALRPGVYEAFHDDVSESVEIVAEELCEAAGTVPVTEHAIKGFRDECLNANSFRNLPTARKLIEAGRRDYNEVRPHSVLDYRTPAEFSALLTASATEGTNMGRLLK